MVQLICASFHQTNVFESLNVLSIYKQIFSAQRDNQVKRNPMRSHMNAPPVCLRFTVVIRWKTFIWDWSFNYCAFSKSWCLVILLETNMPLSDLMRYVLSAEAIRALTHIYSVNLCVYCSGMQTEYKNGYKCTKSYFLSWLLMLCTEGYKTYQPFLIKINIWL